MLMNTSISPYRNTLKSILAAAENIKYPTFAALCKVGREPAPAPDVPFPHLNLPTPSILHDTLAEGGCPLETAQVLSDSYLRTVHQFRTIFDATYQKTVRALVREVSNDGTRLSYRLEQIKSLFQRMYEEKLRAAEQLTVERARTLSEKHSGRSSRPTFNQEFVPLLETYFQHNAYPSAADRNTLARKSMMTPRQIEVWFQNHRNRAKKEGKPLRRLDPDTKILNLPLEPLKERMPLFFTLPKERPECTQFSADESSTDEAERESEQSRPTTPETSSISAIRPPYAFPTSYPPPGKPVFLPKEVEDYTFPHPVWQRQPATSRPPHPVIAFDDFIEDFRAKLVIRDISLKKQFRKSSLDAPWFAATRTVVARAPHPALIRPSSQSRNQAPTWLPPIAAPASHTRPFRYPSAFSEPVTLSFVLSDRAPTRRKIAGLPRRTPKHASISHRQTRRGIAPASSTMSSSLSVQSLPADRLRSDVRLSLCDESRSSSSSSSSMSSENLFLSPTSSATSLPEEHASPMSETSSTCLGG